MKNKYAKVLRFIGIVVIIGGIIGSFVLGDEYGRWSLNWTVALIGLTATAISGALFLGFAETINLLDSINEKLGLNLEVSEEKDTANESNPQ